MRYLKINNFIIFEISILQKRKMKSSKFLTEKK